MSLPKTVAMRSAEGDIDVPTIGFGTWAFGEMGWCYDATLSALEAGYIPWPGVAQNQIA